MTLLNPVLSVENLVYIGYAGDPSSAVRVTRKRRVDRKKQHSDRNVFTEEQYTVNMVDQPGGTKKSLILREIPEDAIEKLLVNKEALGAFASHGESSGYEVPCLIVAAKDDLEPYPNAIEALTGVSQ
ncbi:mitochondrial Rho GTPase 1-like protein, partial [Tanacetum coccineum]